jgi:hypothetical protein
MKLHLTKCKGLPAINSKSAVKVDTTSKAKASNSTPDYLKDLMKPLPSQQYTSNYSQSFGFSKMGSLNSTTNKLGMKKQ